MKKLVKVSASVADCLRVVCLLFLVCEEVPHRRYLSICVSDHTLGWGGCWSLAGYEFDVLPPLVRCEYDPFCDLPVGLNRHTREDDFSHLFLTQCHSLYHDVVGIRSGGYTYYSHACQYPSCSETHEAFSYRAHTCFVSTPPSTKAI